MQTCSYTPLPCLIDNAMTPVNHSYNEGLLSFATDAHFLTHEVSNHTHLDLSLELNRQLHATIRRKHEEISTLKETNAQLRNEAKQMEHYATILEALTTSLQTECTPERLTEDYSPENSWISLLTQEKPLDLSSGASTISTNTDTQQLWSNWDDLLFKDAEDCPSESKRIRFDNEPVRLDFEAQDQLVPEEDWASTQEQTLEMSSEKQKVNIFGAFHGFHVFRETAAVKSDLSMSSDGKVVCFKTSIRDHSTVKTKVFPQGKALTSHTPNGSCRFLWVPNEN